MLLCVETGIEAQQAERNDCLTTNEGGSVHRRNGTKEEKEAETKPNNRRPACGYMKKEVLGEKEREILMRRQFHRWSAWLFDIVSAARLGRLTAPRLAPSLQRRQGPQWSVCSWCLARPRL